MVEMLMPIVENTPLGINCKDGFGMTGLMAALEKGRLEVVERLLYEGEVDLDFTQQDCKGRNVLDIVITSPNDHFMDYVLVELASTLKKGELSKLLLPRLLSCVTQGKVEKFKKILEFYEVNFKDGALLSFLILSGEATYIQVLATHCKWAKATLGFSDLLGRSFMYALQMGRLNMVRSLLKNFPQLSLQLCQTILSPSAHSSRSSANVVKVVKKEIFQMLKDMVVHSPKSFDPETFKAGLRCIGTNHTDEKGFTLLMLALGAPSITAVRILLEDEELNVNATNNAGLSALDILPLESVQAGQLLSLILKRREEHMDVDFTSSKEALLVRALRVRRFHLAILMLDSNFYPSSNAELTNVEDIIDSDKCQLLSNSKKSSLEKKMKLVTLKGMLNKVAAKRRGLLKGKKMGSVMSVPVSSRCESIPSIIVRGEKKVSDGDEVNQLRGQDIKWNMAPEGWLRNLRCGGAVQDLVQAPDVAEEEAWGDQLARFVQEALRRRVRAPRWGWGDHGGEEGIDRVIARDVVVPSDEEKEVIERARQDALGNSREVDREEQNTPVDTTPQEEVNSEHTPAPQGSGNICQEAEEDPRHSETTVESAQEAAGD